VIGPAADIRPFSTRVDVPVDVGRSRRRKDDPYKRRHHHGDEEHLVIFLEFSPVTVAHRGELVRELVKDEGDPYREEREHEEEDEPDDVHPAPDVDQGEGD